MSKDREARRGATRRGVDGRGEGSAARGEAEDDAKG